VSIEEFELARKPNHTPIAIEQNSGILSRPATLGTEQGGEHRVPGRGHRFQVARFLSTEGLAGPLERSMKHHARCAGTPLIARLLGEVLELTGLGGGGFGIGLPLHPEGSDWLAVATGRVR